MSVSCKCCVLSGRGLCDGPITRPEESYRVWCVLSVIAEPQQWRGLGPLGLSKPWKNISVLMINHSIPANVRREHFYRTNTLLATQRVRRKGTGNDKLGLTLSLEHTWYQWCSQEFQPPMLSPWGTQPHFIKLTQTDMAFKESCLSENFFLVLISREYSRIRPNIGRCAVSLKTIIWCTDSCGSCIYGALCFASTCYTVATPL
jgi:hypothetical protein